MGLGNAPKSSRHSQSSGTDAGRQRVIAGDAWIWRTWNFTALGRGNTPADVVGSLGVHYFVAGGGPLSILGLTVTLVWAVLLLFAIVKAIGWRSKDRLQLAA